MEFLINITLKSSIILIGSGILLLGLKRAPATLRHWIISLTMIGLLGLPILTEILPSLYVEMPESVMETKTRQVPVIILEDKVEKVVENERNSVTKPSVTEEIEPIQSADYQIDVSINSYAEERNIPIVYLSQFILGIWFIGFVIFLLKFSIGYYRIRKITINSLPFDLPISLKNYINENSQRSIDVLVSKVIKTPMTWGGIHPVILLPQFATDWTEKELRTVLLHELTHIKRKDYWVHILGLLAVCFYWYNPLIWWMKKQQLLEREKACDEAVIRAGIAQQNYAEQLVAIARQLSRRSSIMNENALPMAKVSQTKARIIAILNYNGNGFRFLKWKQWNWGIFYFLLFPLLAAFSPTAKEIIAENNPLPKLAAISQKISTKGLSNIKIFAPIVAQNETEESVDPNGFMEDLTIETAAYSMKDKSTIIPNLLPNRRGELDNISHKTDIKLPKKVAKKGLFGKWKKGKSEFRICTYGEFEILDKAPFIKIKSPDGVFFLEEYEGGILKGNMHQLTILKAPYPLKEKAYPRESSTDRNKTIPSGEQVNIWSSNKTFLFFSKKKRKWLAGHLDEIKSQIENGNITQVSASNKEWNGQITNSTKWIGHLYAPEKEVQEQDKVKLGRKDFDLNDVQFLKLEQPENLSRPFVLGRKELIGEGISGSLGTGLKGNKYTTVIKGESIPTVLNSLNFHLINDFNNLKFELFLYNIEDGKIVRALQEKPVTIEVHRGEGWVNKDLSEYGIVSKGDILIMLKNLDYTGSKRKKRLYFSLPDAEYNYQPFFDKRERELKFWEQPFMMYFNAQDGQSNGQSMNMSSDNKEKILHGSWKIGKSTFKVWTYGDFKVYNSLPYIEAVGSDDMVIIEETKKSLLGTKTCKVAITKAPFDGIFIQSFRGGNPNSWTHGFKKDDPVHLWTANEEWVFLSKGKDEWMAKNLPKLFWRFGQLEKVSDGQAEHKLIENKLVVQQQQALKQKRFIKAPSEIRDELGGIIDMQPKIEIADIPTKLITLTNPKGYLIRIGRTKTTSTKSGFSGYNAVGRKMGTLIKGDDKNKVIRDFGFNIARNTYDSIAYDLHFFKVVNDEIQQALTEKPIRIEIGKEKGWIHKDLSRHQVGIKGDVLVVMEVVKATPNNMGLFYTLSPGHVLYKPKDQLYKGKKLDFRNGAFAMYLTVDY